MKAILFIARKILIFRKKLLTYFYTEYAKLTAQKYGEGLKVNYKSIFSGKLFFVENCNFNGMNVTCGGTVVFGNTFHSRNNCVMITQNHNYDNVTAIPYDQTIVLKKIITVNCVCLVTTLLSLEIFQ